MKRVVSLFLGAVLALLVAGTALGHTPSASLTCEDGLQVTMTQYNGSVNNRILISERFIEDGSIADIVLDENLDFGSSYSFSYNAFDPTEPHLVNVSVRAGDDPEGVKGWTTMFDLSIGACQQPDPTPKPTLKASHPSVTPPPTSTDYSATTLSDGATAIVLAFIFGLVLVSLILTRKPGQNDRDL